MIGLKLRIAESSKRYRVRKVEVVAKRFPEVIVPVLVGAVEGTAASDFLRAEAFQSLSGILQRYNTMEP